MQLSLLLLVFLILTSAARSEDITAFDNFNIYLHTVDVGNPLPEKYGHVQLRIQLENGADNVFTWGIYVFDDDFVLNHLRGVLHYKIRGFPTPEVMKYYQLDNRTVWEDKLNLTSLQKGRLISNLNTQLRLKNQTYLYHYFLENCSTRPRDLIDYALKGALGKFVDGQFSGRSFRDTVRTHQATTLLTGLGLEVIMNGRLDKPMTVWQEMFLPQNLREYLLEMPQVDDKGQIIPGTKLLTPMGTLLEAPSPEASPWRDYVFVWAVLSFLLIALFWLLREPQLSSASIFVWSFIIAVWGCMSAFLGFYMAASTIFSEIADLQWSAHQWLFWPTDIVYVIWGVMGMIRLQVPRPSRWTKFMEYYTYAHLGCLVLLILLSLLGIVKQDIWRVMMTLGACALVVQIGVLYIGRLDDSNSEH